MIGINLIAPEKLHARLNRRRMRQWTVVVAIVGGLGLAPALWAALETAQLSNLRQQQETLSIELAAARKNLVTTTQSAGSVSSEIEQASAFKRKRDWSGVLALIAQCLPPDAWLESVSTDPQAPPLAGSTPGGRRTGPSSAPPVLPAPAAANPTDAAHPATAPSGPRVVEIDAPRRLIVRGQASTYESAQLLASRLSTAGSFTAVTVARSVKVPSGDIDLYSFDIECEW